MGIRGRFLFYIAAAVGIGFLSFLIFAFLVGKIVGIIALAVVSVAGYLYSFMLQRKGLHSKAKHKGVYVITTLFTH